MSRGKGIHRRGFLAAATGVIGSLAGCAGTDGDRTTGSTTSGNQPGTTHRSVSSDGDGSIGTTPPMPDAVGLEPVATGFTVPLDLAVVPGTDRLYVAEQGGLVHVIEGGKRLASPLLDRRSSIAKAYEAGLLGIALHPEFETNRRLFVRYSAPPRAGTPAGSHHTFVLSEFTVSEDGHSVEPGSERTLLEIPEPQSNHNSGAIVFGPDGFLYIGVGDGGGGGDKGQGHVEDWYAATPGGNGQDVTENLLGSVLRIDVDDRTDGKPYGIPESNPLVGKSGLEEHYAWGFRNPWRLSFDGHDLYAGDVGQSRYEEVDVVEVGGNYGWNVREGAHCYGTRRCPDETASTVRGGEPLRPPIVEYPHSGQPVSGISVIVGNVYRGADYPGLRGRFLFGDLRAQGRLFVAAPTEEGLWPTRVLPIADADADRLQQLFSMDRDGETFYVLGSGSEGGGLFRIG